MNPNLSVNVRVWCSPRADSQYPWKWSVDNREDGTTMEFGAEVSEEDAKREATQARASWIEVLTNMNK